MDREKKAIMANLEGLTWDDWHMYHSDTEVQNIAKSVFDLLIALLKEQEPVKQNDGSCPNCGWNFESGDLDFSNLDSQKFFCPNCGQAVKWDD